MKRTVLSIVTVVLLLSHGAAHADEATEGQAKELKSLQGEWRLESVEVNGKSTLPEEGRKLIRLEIKGDTGTTTYAGLDLVESEQFTLDPSKSPKHLDLLALKGASKWKTHKCIYSLEKDEFKIAVPSSPDAKRPTNFTTGKDDSDAEQLQVWRRVK